MADKKAEITNINLESGQLNLDDEQIQITGYEGYNKKNSMFLGGQLKNWYKKSFSPTMDVPGAKIIQKWHEHVIWQDGEGVIYKDNTPLGSFEKEGFKIEDFTNKPISTSFTEASSTPTTISNVQFTIKGDNVTFEFKVSGVQKKVEMALAGLYSLGVSYGNDSDGGHGDTVYVTLYNRTNYLSCYYDINSNQFVQDQRFMVFGYRVIPAQNIGGTRKTYDCVCITGDTDTTHTYYSITDGNRSFTFSKIMDSNSNGTGGWSRGRKVGMVSYNMRGTYGKDLQYYALYYNFEQTGISYNNSVAVSNIDTILFDGTDCVYYRDSERKIKKLSIVQTNYLECQPIVKDRYLLVNTTSYENTIDLETGMLFCRSDDYNDRCRIITTGDTNYLAVTSWNEQVEVKQDVAFSSVYPARLQKGGTVTSVEPYRPSEKIPHPINVYIGDREGIVTPSYHDSWDIELGQIKTNYDLSNMYYPMNEFPLYNTSVTAKFTDIYLNYALVDEGGYSFITQTDQYQNMIFGYYPSTYIQLGNLFVIQGTIYGINNQYIVRLSVDKSTITDASVVCNKSDMQYIGATPKSALFYSPMDKSIYLFTGDQSMIKAYDCNKISKVYNFYNNPATGFILISTDVGVIGIYNDQVFSLEDLDFKGYLYYTNNSYVIDNVEYTPYKKEGYERVPIVLETKFYGSSNEVKSINDCVYIRLFSENAEPNGTVKVWCETLNEKSMKSPEKIFYIDKSMFDPVTQSMYVRYQPKFQEATGFRVHIESDFSICTVSISHKAETVQNAKYNL